MLLIIDVTILILIRVFLVFHKLLWLLKIIISAFILILNGNIELLVSIVCCWFYFREFESECLPEDREFIRISFRLSDAKEERASEFSRVLCKGKKLQQFDREHMLNCFASLSKPQIDALTSLFSSFVQF